MPGSARFEGEAMMRWRVLASAAVLLLAPQVARAQGSAPGAANARMAAMEQRMRAMEDKLGEQSEVIEQQRAMLDEKATPAVAQGSPETESKLDGFLNNLDIGGFLAGSYLYSFNNPDSNGFGQNGDGTTFVVAPQRLCAFNCGHNEFSFDAGMLSLGKAAAEPGDAGFQLDLLTGQNATILRSLTFDRNRGSAVFGGENVSITRDWSGTSDFDLFVQEAYVSYNMRGTTLKFGKFETLLGYELIDSYKNSNVTQGILFTWAIPLYHTGLLASGSFGDENLQWGWAAGVTNGFNNSTDSSDNKGLLGQLSMTAGPFFGSFSTYLGTLEEQVALTSGTVGALHGDDDPLTQIYDVVLQFKPTDPLKLWLNADYGNTDRNNAPIGSASWYGASTGASYDFTEKLFMAVRGEWFRDNNDSRFAFGPVLFGAGRVDETTAISATATLGYRLTQNLMARLELRHDDVDVDASGGPDVQPFPEDDNLLGGEDNDTYGIFEVSYVFE